jgi:spermidine/putrescine-binding protein
MMDPGTSLAGMRKLRHCFAIIVVLLAGCNGTDLPVRPAGNAAGYECPEAEHPVQVSFAALNILTRTEYVSQDIIECFELIYGIKVNRDEYSGNVKLFDKLSAEATAYDLVLTPDHQIASMVRENLLQELDRTRLPILKNLDPNYLDFEFDPGNKYTIPYQVGTDAIVVNTDTIKTVPESWADLWNEEYANRMIFVDDARAVIGMTLLSLGYDLNTTDVRHLADARDKLAELVPRIKFFDGDSPKTALISGDADLGMIWTGEAFLASRQNPAIRYVYPSEGAILWQDNWAIPADAPHVDAAYAWLNYTMQGDVFWMMLRDFPYTNPNKAALEYARANQKELFDAYMASPITNTPAAAIKNSHRILDIGDAQALYDQIWMEVKSGN